MLRRTLLAAAVSGLCPAAFAAEIVLPETKVSFTPPEGFTELTPAEIKAKWVRGAPPAAAVGNARRSTTIAWNINDQNFPEAGMEAGLQQFEKVFNRLIPGIVWKKREVTVINGKRWVCLEMTSSALDTDIHNILLLAPCEKRLVMFNFNSTRAEFPKLEAALRKSIGTIVVRE